MLGAMSSPGGKGGVLVEHGTAPYEHNPENRESYYVTQERGGGQDAKGPALHDYRAGEMVGLAEFAGADPARFLLP